MIETNRLKKALQQLLPVFAVFLATSASMWAQAGGGSMVGTVHDPAGAVVPNAAVTITNSDTNTTYPVVTNGDGRFLYPQLPVGTYKVSVTAPGFKEAVQEGITVSIGTTCNLDIPLQVGQTSQSVTRERERATDPDGELDVGTTVPLLLVPQLPFNFSGVVRSPLIHDINPGLSWRFLRQPPVAG